MSRIDLSRLDRAMEAIARRSSKPAAIICDLGLSGFGTALSLGRAGIPVVGLSSDPRCEGVWSRYAHTLVCPDAESAEMDFIALLERIGGLLSRNGAVLIPTGDASAIAVSKNRRQLDKLFRIPFSSYETLRVLSDKNYFRAALEELSAAHPRTYSPTVDMPIERIAERIEYPCLIKPLQSSRFVGEFRAKALRAANARELLSAFHLARSSNHPAVIQEVVPGPDSNLHLVHGYYDHCSRPTAVFTLRRIRQYPPGLGNGTMCIAEWSAALADQVNEFIASIGYQGIVDAELKLDPRDGKFKFIEINPRPGWQIRLGARCGVNVPYAAYLDAVGRGGKSTLQGRDGTRWVFVHLDLKSGFSGVRSGAISIADFLRSYASRIEWAVFAWDDPQPFLRSFMRLIGAAARRLARFIRSTFGVGQ